MYFTNNNRVYFTVYYNDVQTSKRINFFASLQTHDVLWFWLGVNVGTFSFLKIRTRWVSDNRNPHKSGFNFSTQIIPWWKIARYKVEVILQNHLLFSSLIFLTYVSILQVFKKTNIVSFKNVHFNSIGILYIESHHDINKKRREKHFFKPCLKVENGLRTFKSPD